MTTVGASSGLTLTAAKLLFGGAIAKGANPLEPSGISVVKPATSILAPGVAPVEAADPSKVTAAERTAHGRSLMMRAAMANGHTLGMMGELLDGLLAEPELNSVEEAIASGSEERVRQAELRQNMMKLATVHLTNILGHAPVVESDPEGGQRMAAFIHEEKYAYGDGQYIDFAASGGGGEKVRYTLLDSETSLHWTYQYEGGGKSPRGVLVHTNA